jgi:hypothetical protein
MSRSAIKHCRKQKRKKMNKQSSRLAIISSMDGREDFGKKYSTRYLQENFDGGVDILTAPLCNPEVSGWCCHRITDGHLEVCSPPSCNQGLMYKDGDMNPSIEINNDARALCNAMSNVARKKNKLVRGASKTGVGNHKYCCVGSRARRNAPGVESGHFNLDGAPKADWNTIVHAVK